MKKRMAVRHGSLWFDVLNVIFFCLVAALFFYPFYYMLLRSLADASAGMGLGLSLWNSKWTLLNYQYVFTRPALYVAYRNTIGSTVLTTLGALTMIMLAAYPMSKKYLPGRGVLTVFFLIPMFFSGGLIPSFMLMRNLGLYNSFWVLVIPSLFSVYNFVLARNYISSLDPALEEAAMVEGANYMQLLIKIVSPLSKPILATLALWTAVDKWNQWFAPMIYTSKDSLLVLQLFLRRYVESELLQVHEVESFMREESKTIVSASIEAAITIVCIGPIIMVYPFIQKHFVKGIMIGSLKG